MARTLRPLEAWANKPFEAGDGLHSDLFAAACFMIEEGHDDNVIFQFLSAAANQVGARHVPDREIRSAINYGRAKFGGNRMSEQWPAILPLYRQEVIAYNPADMNRLLAGEDRLPQETWKYLSALYSPEDLVCAAATSDRFTTSTRDRMIEFTRTHLLQFINPSPMSAFTGVTVEGKTSAHCEANTGRRKYLVTEFDVGTPYEQASIVRYLATKMPLVMIVYSGGKSIHGWFHTEGQPEEYVKTFFTDAVTLGADTVTWSRCQFCRMPAGFNPKTGRRQSVLYFKKPSLLPK